MCPPLLGLSAWGLSTLLGPSILRFASSGSICPRKCVRQFCHVVSLRRPSTLLRGGLVRLNNQTFGPFTYASCCQLCRSKNNLINCPLSTWVCQFYLERTHGVTNSCSRRLFPWELCFDLRVYVTRSEWVHLFLEALLCFSRKFFFFWGTVNLSLSREKFSILKGWMFRFQMLGGPRLFA